MSGLEKPPQLFECCVEMPTVHSAAGGTNIHRMAEQESESKKRKKKSNHVDECWLVEVLQNIVCFPRFLLLESATTARRKGR